MSKGGAEDCTTKYLDLLPIEGGWRFTNSNWQVMFKPSAAPGSAVGLVARAT